MTASRLEFLIQEMSSAFARGDAALFARHTQEALVLAAEQRRREERIEAARAAHARRRAS